MRTKSTETSETTTNDTATGMANEWSRTWRTTDYTYDDDTTSITRTSTTTTKIDDIWICY